MIVLLGMEMFWKEKVSLVQNNIVLDICCDCLTTVLDTVLYGPAAIRKSTSQKHYLGVSSNSLLRIGSNYNMFLGVYVSLQFLCLHLLH